MRPALRRFYFLPILASASVLGFAQTAAAVWTDIDAPLLEEHSDVGLADLGLDGLALSESRHSATGSLQFASGQRQGESTWYLACIDVRVTIRDDAVLKDGSAFFTVDVEGRTALQVALLSDDAGASSDIVWDTLTVDGGYEQRPMRRGEISQQQNCQYLQDSSVSGGEKRVEFKLADAAGTPFSGKGVEIHFGQGTRFHEYLAAAFAHRT